ncbi:LysE family translocator [Myxococcota bacterium]|nr:LysE family translocator [Myxococcota bacterium]
MIQMWIAAILGFGMGFAGSIPLAGPTTMLVLSFGIQGRIRAAAGVAAGSALPEAVYASLALWGFGTLIERFHWVAPVSRGFAIAILLLVGLFLLLRPPGQDSEASQEVADQTGMGRSFLLGMSLTAFNPALILNWGAAATMLYSLEILDPNPSLAIPFGLGAASGILSWFVIVLVLLHRHRARISPKLRSRLLRSMGGILIGLALLAAARSWLRGDFI